MAGLLKSSFYKCIGNGLLTWPELCEIVLDVEVALNNRPLSYLEEDIQLPVLTPASCSSSRVPSCYRSKIPASLETLIYESERDIYESARSICGLDGLRSIYER